MSEEMRAKLLCLFKRYGNYMYCQGSFAARDKDNPAITFLNYAAGVKREFIGLINETEDEDE